MQRERWLEIDVLKTACILAVVLIHSLSTSMWPANPVGLWIGHLTRFAVPGLVFAAGFLFRKTGIGNLQLLRNLAGRILPPYFCCSLLIVSLDLSDTRSGPNRLEPSTIVFDLASGNVLGIYYFIFVILYLYSLSFLLRLLPKPIMWGLWGISLSTAIAFYLWPFRFMPPIPFALARKMPRSFLFVAVRHPCMHLPPYLTGWVTSLSYDRLRPWLKENFKPVVAVAVAADIYLLAILPGLKGFSPTQLAVQAHVFLAILCLLSVGIRGIGGKAAVAYLSRRTYGVFLIHLPIVRAVQALFPQVTRDFSPPHCLAAWCVGVMGSLALIALAQRVLGKYARHVVGA